jgi:TolA-binding protein
VRRIAHGKLFAGAIGAVMEDFRTLRMRVLAGVLVTVLSAGWAMGATGEDPFIRGQMALEDGFAGVAEESFRECLQSGALSGAEASRARDYLLRSLLMQEKYDEMLELLSSPAAGTDVSADVACYWGAVVLHRQSHYAEAAEQLSGFQTNWPSSHLAEAALRLLGGARLKSGDVQGAADTFEAFGKLYPESSESSLNRLDLGRALLFLGNLQDAIQVLHPVMLDPEAGHVANEARYWIGKAHLQAEEADKAQAVFAPLVAERKEVPEGLRVKVLLVVSGILARDGKTDDAVQLLGDSLADVRGADAKRSLSESLARVLLKAKRLDEAMPLVKAYASGNPDSVAAAGLQLELGDVLLDVERYEDAILVYQQYLEAFADAGDHARARQGLGWALLGAERYAESALAFEKAYELFADAEQRMVCLFKIADARFKNEQYQQALSTYQLFIQEFGGSEYEADAMFQIGASAAELKQYEDAEAAFDAVIDKHPESLQAEEALLRIAELREAQEDWKGAAAAFQRLMKGPEKGRYYARALHGRGIARYQQWQPEALEDFERVVKEFPDADIVEHSYFMRAMCLYRLGRDAQALSICREFLAKYGESNWAPSVRFWIGRFAYNTGDFKAAEVEFLLFAEEFPKHVLADRAVYRAAMAALKRKEFVKSIELFGRLAKAYPSSDYLAEARFRQADAMCELGKFAGAILVFEEVVNNYPSSDVVPLAWGRKGDCQFTLGAENASRYEEAIRSYRVVTQSPVARQDHVWQAEYKLARCLEKLERPDEALDHYYSRVMVPFLVAKERGDAISESARTWFTRASLGAADIVTSKRDWRQLVRILERVVEADVAVSAEAIARIKTIKSENWWLFY